MELLFQSTREFEEDLKKIDLQLRKKIIKKMNAILSEKSLFFSKAYQPVPLKLKGDFESSMYMLRIDSNVRIILTYDEDPLFDQIIVTLLAISMRDGMEKKFKSIGESLYQGYIHEESKGENENNGTN